MTQEAAFLDCLMKGVRLKQNKARTAKVSRETGETVVKVELDLDGSGDSRISTGIRIFDHMLSQLAKHSLLDLKVSANGSDYHHLVEDVAIVLGRALTQALGNREGIVRMAHALVPMDEALALVALDIGGRGNSALEASFSAENIGELPTDLIGHFLQSLAAEAKINLHARVLAGTNDHHKAEALFKALARALGEATRLDPRLSGKIPSTKEVIDG